MTKKIITSIFLCLITTISILLLPACSWFEKDKVEVNKSTSIQGGNQNTPNSRYSAFLNSVEETKNYIGSYKLNFSLTQEVSTYEYYEHLQSFQKTDSSTFSIAGSNSLDAKNFAYYANIYKPGSTPVIYSETVFNNIKTSDDENASDYYVDKSRKFDSFIDTTGTCITYKTNSNRSSNYTIGNASLVKYLPTFDNISAANNTSIIGSRDYSAIKQLTAYLDNSYINDNFYSFIKNIDSSYLTLDNITAEIGMPEHDTQTIVQLKVTASSENDSSEYKYKNYEIVVKYYCSNGKVSKITQTYNLNESKSEHSKYYINKNYDKNSSITFNADIEYFAEWDNQSEDYNNIFRPELLTSKISEDRENINSCSYPTNTINVVLLNTNKTIFSQNFIQKDVLISDDIFTQAKTQPALTYNPSNNTYTENTVDVEFYADKECTDKILGGRGFVMQGSDITLYAKYVVPNGKCLIMIREFSQPYKKLANYYVPTNILNLDYLNTPIICSMEDSSYNYPKKGPNYNNIKVDGKYVYDVQTYLDNVKNTTNKPLSYRPGKLIYLDFYLNKK